MCLRERDRDREKQNLSLKSLSPHNKWIDLTIFHPYNSAKAIKTRVFGQKMELNPNHSLNLLATCCTILFPHWAVAASHSCQSADQHKGASASHT